MPHAYTEDQLVEQPAIRLFAELGWAVAGPPPNAGMAGELQQVTAEVWQMLAAVTESVDEMRRLAADVKRNEQRIAKALEQARKTHWFNRALGLF